MHLKNKFESIFIDLDGTLIDSMEGIKNGMIYMLEKTNKSTNLNFNEYVGPPIHKSFLRIYSEDELEKAISYFREYYWQKGQYECRLYNNVEKALQIMIDKGYKLYVCTSKKNQMTNSILKNKRIRKYFLNVYATVEPNLINKKDILNFAIEDSKSKRRTSIIVGDTIYDANAAKDNHIDCFIVTTGYADYSNMFPCEVGRAKSLLEFANWLE